MKKSKVPTSQYQVFCDTYDMKGEVKLHLTDDKEQKLHIELSDSEDVEDYGKKSLSLYREDVGMLVAFLSTAMHEVAKRNK